MIRILPYKLYSKSAKKLVSELSPLAKIKNATRAPRFRNQTIINWGNSNIQFDLSRHTVINNPASVRVAANKLSSLIKLKEKNVSVCDFTTNKDVVRSWLQEGYRVVVRHILNGHSGKGIEILEGNCVIPNAPLYTKYHKKTNEFRVHVFDGIIIDYIEKKARQNASELPNYNSLIRSYNNGWVYCRDNILHSESVKKEALKATRALGLDFAAVDVIISKGKAIVLECNTAPGLEGTTLLKYKEAILNIQNGI